MSNRERFLGLGLAVSAAFALAQFAVGQSSTHSDRPLIIDWSSQHVVFSRPRTQAEAKRLERDPRYWAQRARQFPQARQVFDAVGALPDFRFGPFPRRDFARDWSQNMGSDATVGATNYPAKYSFSLTTANCANATQPDFVVYATGLTGGAGQASIVAYDNLYSGCTAPVPQVYWAYDTAGGTVTTSPVFSEDGTQVAFVQTNSSGFGELVLLRWAASTTEIITNPMPLSRVDNTDYPGCTPPCMTTGLLIAGDGVTQTADVSASVSYDYAHDTAYIGDESGWLHKINPVFNGVPAEVRSAGWPVQVNPSAPTALTSPVYDPNSERVFVNDIGGYLYRIGPDTAVVAQSGQLDFSLSADGGPGIVQGPMIDSDVELVYTFVTADGTGLCALGADCSAIFILSADFPAGDFGSEAYLGNSSVEPAEPSPMFIGRWDSTYINSGTATGNFYVCGNTGGTPILYQLPLTLGVAGTAVPGPVLSANTTPCSPVSDIYNPNTTGGATEWIFASTETDGSASACASGGCLYNFVDTPWQAKTSYAIGQQVLDTHFQIQVATNSATSGASTPSWTQLPGHTTPDGGVTWINQGTQSGTTPGHWLPSHTYTQYSRVLDGNNNIQIATVKPHATTGTSPPAFNPLPGKTTNDGTEVWVNAGQIATQALAATGGTSGIIMDNTVSTGVQAGASEVYFSTLGNGSCGGGCAVQASQSGLK